MNKPFLFLALFASIATLPTLARADRETENDARERAERKAKLDRAWDKLEAGGERVADGIGEFFTSAGEAVRSGIHHRPELQTGHLAVLRKGNSVRVHYCRARIAHLFRNRDEDKSNRCAEPLHAKAFNIEQLRACAARHAEGNALAFNLDRQLGRIIHRNDDYDFNYVGMYAGRGEYRELFKTCEREIASRTKPAAKPKAPVASQPAPKPQEEKPEFKPVPESAPSGQGGDLEPMR